MKKLLLMLFALITTGAWAQTDVTSTYLTNPSFEYSAEGTNGSAQALTNGGAYYGWTLPSLGTSFVNISIGDASACNGQAFGIPSAKDGNLYYFTRRGWNSSNSADATLATTASNLPVGHYSLSMDYKGLDSWDNSHNVKGSYLKIEAVEGDVLASVQTSAFEAVNGNSAGANKFSGDSNWKSVTLEFDVTTAGDVTINIVHHFVGGVRTDAVIDNLTLTYTDPEAAAHAAALEAAKYTLNGYIKKATALKDVLADETLATAITTAQGVYDDANDYAEDYDNTVAAATTLNTAITTALSATTAVALTNGNFDTDVNIAIDGTNSASIIEPATSAKPYIYPVTGWEQNFTFNATASQGNTAVYGATITGDKGNNGTNPPATDMFGGTEGGTLHLSSGWSDQARYKQVIENLPAGRYVFYYEANNQNSSANTINSNYFGVSGTAGDFYGTTNSFVYSEEKTFVYDTWTSNAIEFDLAKDADITFHVGVVGTTGGSANGAKLWIDNVLVYRIGDVIVTDGDASAIITEVEALGEAVYNADKKDALATAMSTFEGSKTLDNYNALNEALIAAKASVEVYKTLDKAISNVEGWTSDKPTVTDPIRAKYTNGEYSDETNAASIYETYQAAEIAALAVAEATDYTSAILNPSFETGDMTGWSAESRTDVGVKENSNSTYTTAGVDGTYLFNSWGGTAENNVYQTIKGLPAGTYTLSALLAGFTGEDLVLAANETTNSVTVAGDKTVGYTVNVVFTLDEATDVVIKASNTKGAESSDASFIKADNFKLIAGDVTTDDYTALNEAIAAAEAKTLGFDKNEYAPYNNIEAIKALAAAKAVGQEVPMSQTDLDAIVNALTSATWTANIAEVDAIFDGRFATTEANATSGDINLPGWTKVAGIRLLVKDEATDPGLAYTDGKAAVFSWGGTTLTYGEQEGYTLPLNKGELYEFTLKVSGWRDGDLPNVVTIALDGAGQTVNAQELGAKAINVSEGNPFATLKFYVTPTEDNSKLTIYANHHFTIADLSMKLAVAENLELKEGTTCEQTEEKYANVAITRNIKEGLNTVVLPFALDAEQVAAMFGEGAEVYAYSENSTDANNATVYFNKKDEATIEANVPVLVKATAASSTQAVEGVIVKTTEAKVAGTNFDFVGVYAPMTVAEGDYFVSAGKLYKSKGATNLKAFRAYIENKDKATGEVKLYVDGLETAISEINADAEQENGLIYNLAGQRVSKATKGIYIINGRKVLK